MKNENKSLNQGTGEIGVISPGQMVRRLLAIGSDVAAIASAMEVTQQDVKVLATIGAPSDLFNPVHQRLFKFYVKAKVKSMLRRSPFMGADRACELLQIERETYQDSYQELVRSGEVAFEMAAPDWEGAQTSTLLRKHIVK